jgi:hypothetical protein
MNIVYVSPQPLAISFRSPSGIWNKVSSLWEAIPTGGNPGQDHLIPLIPTATTGALGYEQWATLPDPPASTPGAWCAVFSRNTDGSLQSQVDAIPLNPGLPITIIVGGGIAH